MQDTIRNRGLTCNERTVFSIDSKWSSSPAKIEDLSVQIIFDKWINYSGTKKEKE